MLCYCVCIELQPHRSNIWAHGAVWALSGTLFLWKCNCKQQGVCAKWRNSVAPACVRGAAKQGVLRDLWCPSPVIWWEGLPWNIHVTYHLPCNSKSPKAQLKNPKQFSSTSLIKSKQRMVNAGCSFICPSYCKRLLFYFDNDNSDILHCGTINIWGLCLRGGPGFPVAVRPLTVKLQILLNMLMVQWAFSLATLSHWSTNHCCSLVLR